MSLRLSEDLVNKIGNKYFHRQRGVLRKMFTYGRDRSLSEEKFSNRKRAKRHFRKAYEGVLTFQEQKALYARVVKVLQEELESEIFKNLELARQLTWLIDSHTARALAGDPYLYFNSEIINNHPATKFVVVKISNMVGDMKEGLVDLFNDFFEGVLEKMDIKFRILKPNSSSVSNTYVLCISLLPDDHTKEHLLVEA